MTVHDLMMAARRTGLPVTLEGPEAAPPALVAGPDEQERAGRPATFAAARWNLADDDSPSFTVVVWMDEETGRVEWHEGAPPELELEWREPEPADGWELEDPGA